MARASGYKPEFAAQAAKIAQLGGTDRDLADFFEVSIRTIHRWKSEFPEFCHSLKLGKDEADARVERSLFQRAVGYDHDAIKILSSGGKIFREEYIEHIAPDTTAAIFWLKNRRPDLWRDARGLEIAGKDGGPIKTEDVSARERLESRIAGIAARFGTGESTEGSDGD